jgi:hypothetical protein
MERRIAPIPTKNAKNMEINDGDSSGRKNEKTIIQHNFDVNSRKIYCCCS